MPGMTMPPKPQQPQTAPQPDNMAAMDMSKPMSMPTPKTLTEAILQHTTSGTSFEPISTPMSMLMTPPTSKTRGWSLMLHSNDFLADTQQQSPVSTGNPARGRDAFFSTNWIMPMAQHSLGSHGQITLRTMLSLEPATIPHGSYPELFQQGETYQGKPIVDGQHPHDFVMELAALYDLHLPAKSLLTLYAAPVGDPAIGPTAYPHRQSASEDPIAALGHHQQDSTHIAFNVLTAGLTHKAFRIEASGFHGAEPTEARWRLQPSPNGLAPDSYSTRLTFAPTKNLAAQYSIAHITAPEALAPATNQRRQTASLMYNRPLTTGNLALTALWGQTKSEAHNSPDKPPSPTPISSKPSSAIAATTSGPASNPPPAPPNS